MAQALGIVETRGLAASIEAAEAITIATLGKERSKDGFVSMFIMIRGEVDAVRQAIEAGTNAASKLGQVTISQVITIPNDDAEGVGNKKTLQSGF